MNRNEVLGIVEAAREKGEAPNLRGAYLVGADLTDANIEGADLRGSLPAGN